MPEARAQILEVPANSLSRTNILLQDELYGNELDYSGRSVSSARDINGDGFDNLIVGALANNFLNYNTERAGKSYVVFGKENFNLNIDVATLDVLSF